jgi:hypothetical protein
LKRLERAQKRLESAEAASADRQAYLVAVIREELGRPSALLQLDGNTRDKRFASCFHRLRNFGGVEIAFGLFKYYDKHWDETEQRGLADDAAADETEVASSFASRKKKKRPGRDHRGRVSFVGTTRARVLGEGCAWRRVVFRGQR